VAIICGLVWFQAGRGIVPERVVPDLTAALFFVNVFNAFNSLFDVLVVCKYKRPHLACERLLAISLLVVLAASQSTAFAGLAFYLLKRKPVLSWRV